MCGSTDLQRLLLQIKSVIKNHISAHVKLFLFHRLLFGTIIIHAKKNVAQLGFAMVLFIFWTLSGISGFNYMSLSTSVTQ